MAGKQITDFGAFAEEQREELESSGRSREDLIAELRELLRNCLLMLPQYQQVQEATRYAMTVEDLEELQAGYVQFSADTANIFEDEDVIDAIVQARTKFEIITYILQNGPGPAAIAEAADERAAASRRGCTTSIVITLVITGTTIASVLWLV